MEKYITNDRGETRIPLLMALSMASIGFTIGVQLDAHFGRADGRVREVQKVNEQVVTQLEKSFDPVTDVRVNDETQKYTFDSVTSAGVQEHCKGAYDSRRDAARLTGDIACSQIVVSGK